MQQKHNDIKNIRLYIPIHIYKRLKKYQAKKILEDQPEQSLAQICVELLDAATRHME